MNSILRKVLFAAVFGLVSFTATAQAIASSDDVIAENDEITAAKKSLDQADLTTNNFDVVRMEIGHYLQTNLELREDLFWVYNTDVKLMASITVNEDGQIASVHFLNKIKHPTLEGFVVETLEELYRVEPVLENGKTITKTFLIPVFFDFDL